MEVAGPDAAGVGVGGAGAGHHDVVAGGNRTGSAPLFFSSVMAAREAWLANAV